jgi:hypothetical protein
MAILTIDLVFADLTDEDLLTVHDQIEQIKKSVERSVISQPVGKYLTEIDVQVI